MSTELDSFTKARLIRFIGNFRDKSGALPTLADLGEGGFSDEQIKKAIKTQVIEKFYITLTNGTIVKGFKVSD